MYIIDSQFLSCCTLYIATKKTCQINQIITVNSPMNAPISETYSSQKNNSCTPCVPMFNQSRSVLVVSELLHADNLSLGYSELLA